MPESTSSKVDLPHPDGPTTEKNSPRAISRSIGPSACTPGCPSWAAKTLVRPRRLKWPFALAPMPDPSFDELQAGIEGCSKDENEQRQCQNVGDRVNPHGAQKSKADTRGRCEQLADQGPKQRQ